MHTVRSTTVNYQNSVYNRVITKGASKVKHYEVVAAIIEHEGKILCMQRNKGKFDYVSYKYEFPGGKIEAGEDIIQPLSESCGKKWIWILVFLKMITL